jgi:hypothetical protein
MFVECLERWILLFYFVFHSNRIIQTRIFLYVCETPAAVAAAAPPAELRRGDASATKAPASPAFPAVVAAAASAAASETSRRRRHEGKPLTALKIQISIFCTGVVSEIQNSSKFGFFALE